MTEGLIDLVRHMREANERGEALGLTEDAIALYDALETNDSAVKVLGDETLRTIARELVATVCLNVTIDWTVKENVHTQMHVLVKHILRPPDKQEKATPTVLIQAEVLSQEWAAVASIYYSILDTLPIISKELCYKCSLKPKCTKLDHRTITVSKHYSILEEAKRYSKSQDYKDDMKMRAHRTKTR